MLIFAPRKRLSYNGYRLSNIGAHDASVVDMYHQAFKENEERLERFNEALEKLGKANK